MNLIQGNQFTGRDTRLLAKFPALIKIRYKSQNDRMIGREFQSIVRYYFNVVSKSNEKIGFFQG